MAREYDAGIPALCACGRLAQMLFFPHKDFRFALAVESPYGAVNAQANAAFLKALLSEMGYRNASVEVATENVPPAGVNVVFIINEGQN